MLRQETVSETETRLVVSGSLYGESGSEFESKIEALFKSAFAIITIDFSMALGITSAAIGKLVSVYKRLLAQKRTVRIDGCSDMLYSIFMRIKLDTLIQIKK